MESPGFRLASGVFVPVCEPFDARSRLALGEELAASQRQDHRLGNRKLKLRRRIILHGDRGNASVVLLFQPQHLLSVSKSYVLQSDNIHMYLRSFRCLLTHDVNHIVQYRFVRFAQKPDSFNI